MATASEWNERYAAGDIPWDMGRPHPMLVERLEADRSLGLGAPGRAYVPGCGRGWDAVALAESGWQVSAVDAAPAAVEHARRLLEPLGGSAAEGNAFDHDRPADLVFDHTFFCAISPEQRPRFGDMAANIVEAGGGVISIVFPLHRQPPTLGPPYRMEVEDLDQVLGSSFERVETGAERMIGRRRWPHRWARWLRS